MADVTIFHNPKCSKSRAAMELLGSRGLDVEVVEYLERPPSEDTLRRLIDACDEPPQAFVRSGDSAFAEAGHPIPDGPAATAAFLSRHARFLQRPVVVIGRRAVIGRPTDKIAEALDEAGL